jgi:ribonucleoside-diphosphate reductase alpha chain
MDSQLKLVSDGKFSDFARAIYEQKYAHTTADGRKETWEQTAARVARHVLDADGKPKVDDLTIQAVYELIRDRKFMPGGRYLYAAGRPFHQTQNCLLLRAEDSREGWADLMQKATMALMTGAGIGVDYSAIRPEGAPISRTGGTCTGPLALMQMVNEAGRHIMQGGARRSAIWAGLRWNHPDVRRFIDLKDWSPEIRAAKEKDYNAPAPMDGTNISVILDADFFREYNQGNPYAKDVYWHVVWNMLSTAEPGFSVDFDNPRESLRNACTEVVSEDDSDICNLGSINMARIGTLSEFSRIVELGTIFLLAGTLYSHVPYSRVADIRTKNRRLGLGLMGIHEWLLQRGKKYGPDSELASWLETYREVSTRTAQRVAEDWGISCPVAVRAIAPTGTIGIVAETTTGIEPIFCVAYRRRYKGADGHTTNYQYVVDPTAKRLIEQGTPPELVEDSYTLAASPERRVEFQAWVQQYVDQAISSTINLPEWGSELNSELTVEKFGEMLMQYLPRLRGITAYPDGSRGGQPLVRVKYETAISHEGQVFVEQADSCDITKGGSCGS